MNKKERMFALIHKNGSKLYPYRKRQLSTDRYGYALTGIGEQDRIGGGTYVDDIETVVKKLVFDGWSVRAKTLDGSIKPLEGTYGIGKISIVGYELDSSLWHIVKYATSRPVNYSEPPQRSVAIESVSREIEGKVLCSIKERRGQAKFRQALLLAYNEKCCISGSEVVSILEAAHVKPHSEETDYSVFNGLLLRADLHTLYDLDLVSIDYHGEVHVSQSLKNSEYWQYKGKKVLSDVPEQMAINLSTRFDRFIAKNGS